MNAPAKPPASWTTPRLLRLALGGLWLAALVLAAYAEVEVAEVRASVKTIGRDAAPSIVAAQEIYANLADLDATAANFILADEAALPAIVDTFDKRRHTAVARLVAAAENITYGEAERAPILKMIDQLGLYLELVGVAKTLHQRGDSAAAIAGYNQASDLMHQRILPAGLELDQANRHMLDAAWTREQAAGTRQGPLLAVAALVLGALLVVQLFLARRMRRWVNLPLLGATLLTAGFFGSLEQVLASQASHLRTAKEDCFESVHALWQARATAYDANGEESRFLLDKASASVYAQAFRADATRLWSGTDVSAINKTSARGFLEKELANVTFAGEQQAAEETLARWQDYLRVDQRIRTLEQAGKHADSVALCLGNKEGESNWVFDRFDQALGATLEINQREFDRTVELSFHELDPFRWAGPLTALLIALLVWLGLRPRLREYQI